MLDMESMNSRIASGWTEEPASDVFRRTADRFNFRLEDFDAHAFVHGGHTDPNAPIVNAEAFDPIEIWDGLVFSFRHGDAAPEDFSYKGQDTSLFVLPEHRGLGSI